MADRGSMQTGRVIAAHGRRGLLETGPDNRLPYLVQGRRLRVVCGDLVEWVADDHGKLAVVTGILPRSNALERQPPGRTGTEVLAANLSLMIVVSAPSPEPDWFLIDRYLCTGKLMGCDLLLAVNKADVPDERRIDAAALRDYERIGYQCILVSARTGQGLDELRSVLKEKTAILVGQSGVGKSSLIYRLVPDADIAVGTVSAATREGIHTTTASALHDVPGGGRLIDTPGVRDFVPAIPESNHVQAGFPEILEAAAQCRFTDCRHLREPDCAVKSAVDGGSVTPRRYESYKRLLRAVTN